MLLDNTYWLPNLFDDKKVNISIVSFKQNMNSKIQILAGNRLMSRFHVGFEIELPLEVSRKCGKKQQFVIE